MVALSVVGSRERKDLSTKMCPGVRSLLSTLIKLIGRELRYLSMIVANKVCSSKVRRVSPSTLL